MNVNTNTPLSFTARNKEIRYADKIMRNMMNHYPAIAPSKCQYYDVIKSKPDLIIKTGPINWLLKSLRTNSNSKCFSNEVPIKNIFDNTKKFKVANCLEMAQMAKAAFIANGYEDVKIANLKLNVDIINRNGTKENYKDRIDHALLLVNGTDPNKKAFIVDAWRGFVDYLDNGLTRYDSIFMKGLRDFSIKGETVKQRIKIFTKDNRPITKEICKDMAQKYPELVVKK